jgi:hypothetical protein
MPGEVPVLRVFIGHIALIAPKSIFAVFRVPSMNLIHGTIASVMLMYAPAFTSPERRSGYSRILTTLLFAVGLKSVMEALELSMLGTGASAWLRSAIATGTVACVLGGVALAAWHSRKVTLPWPELQLPLATKLTLASLCGVYLLIVAASLWVAHRVPNSP